jgi:hypothetical protein
MRAPFAAGAMTAWLVLAGLAFVFALRFAWRRRALFTVLPTESISTLHGQMSKRQTAETKAALDAATATLR